MNQEIDHVELELVFENSNLDQNLNKSRSPEEFNQFIAFENDEISIEDVTPQYCPNTIE